MITEDYVKSVIEFLDRSNINILYPPNIVRQEYDDHIASSVFLGSHIKVFSRPIPNNMLLNISIVFMSLDIYVDSKYPHLEGNSFRTKLNGLNQNSDEERILYNIFRIFKLFRNTITHSIGALSVQNSIIDINYSFNNTNFKIKCSEKALDYLFTIVFMYITNNTSSYRKVTYLRSYYDILVLEIFEFEDDIGSSLDNLQDLNDSFIFNALERRVEVNLVTDYYCIYGNCICFQNNYYRLLEQEKPYTSVDFTIGFARSKYKIPYEAIENNCIAISDLKNWKI